MYITILNIPRQILKKKSARTSGSSLAHPFCASGELRHIIICCWQVGEAGIHIWVERKYFQFFLQSVTYTSLLGVFCSAELLFRLPFPYLALSNPQLRLGPSFKLEFCISLGCQNSWSWSVLALVLLCKGQGSGDALIPHRLFDFSPDPLVDFPGPGTPQREGTPRCSMAPVMAMPSTSANPHLKVELHRNKIIIHKMPP